MGPAALASMILEALYRYCQRIQQQLSPPGYSKEPSTFSWPGRRTEN
jgi:hypothetical protein